MSAATCGVQLSLGETERATENCSSEISVGEVRAIEVGAAFNATIARNISGYVPR